MYEQSLENMSVVIKKNLSESNKKIKRLKTRAIVKTVVTTLILVGGVTASVLIPNPISVAVAIGAATVLSGSEGIKHTLKKLKSTKFLKNQIKQSDKDTDEKLLVNKLRNQVHVNNDPSAPMEISMYPNLRV